MKVFNKELGYLTLPGKKPGDVEYLAEGGQAKVFVTKDNKFLLKIYHDAQNAIPEDKAKELSSLKGSNIITPVGLLYENNYVGYYMKYIKGAYDLCELFPKGFKNEHNLNYDKRSYLVEKLIKLVQKVHSKNFLVVDLNANNVICAKNLKDLYLIDTDSFKTVNYPAVAIQDIIRDRKVSNNDFNEGSDWFAFACLAFQLYSNVHPYGGVHKKHNKSIGDKSFLSVRMDKGISVFDKDVNFPPTVDNFDLIPKKHLDWFKNVFTKGERSEPPFLGDFSPVKAPSGLVVVNSNDKLSVEEIYSFDKIIQEVHFSKGSFMFKTGDGYYESPRKEITREKGKLPMFSNNGSIKICDLGLSSLECDGAKVDFEDRFYSPFYNYRINNGNLFCDELFSYNKTFFKTNKLLSVGNTAFISDNVCFKKYLQRTVAICFEGPKVLQHFLPEELDKHRLISGKYVGKILLLHYEKNEKYFQVIFDTETKGFIKGKVAEYNKPNIIHLENGVYVKLSGGSISIFKDINKIKKINNTGLDESCRLISNGNTVHMFVDNKFYKITTK